MTRVRPQLLLAALLATVLALRMMAFFSVHAARPDSILRPDSLTYENPALALLRWGRFSQTADSPGRPDTIRTPGYPIFIAVVMSAAGPGRAPVIAAQILLSIGTVALTYAASRRLWRKRPAALLAAAALSADPATFYFSQMLLSETLFTFALTLALYCGLRTASEGARRPRWIVMMSGALAVSALIRPVTYYAFAPVSLWLLWALRRRGASWRAALGWTAAGAIPWLVLAGGWQARNYRAIGDARFCQIENVNLYFYRGAEILAIREGVSLEQMQERLRQQADQETAGAPPRVVFDYYRRHGLDVLKRNPGLALRSWARGLARLLFHPCSLRLYDFCVAPNAHSALMEDARRLSRFAWARKWVLGAPLLAALALGEAFVLLTGYAGLAAGPWLARRRPRWPHHVLWIGAFVYVAAVSAGPEAYSRMRAPLMPIMAVYGGYFVWRLARKWLVRIPRSMPPAQAARR